jgi:beta-fructofuranosidase
MHQLYYQHPETWFGDCMPIFADGAFQLFHQRDTRHPGPFGDPFGWALARTTDFLTYQDLGEVVHRGADDAQDQFIFAASISTATYPSKRRSSIFAGVSRYAHRLSIPAQSGKGSHAPPEGSGAPQQPRCSR